MLSTTARPYMVIKQIDIISKSIWIMIFPPPTSVHSYLYFEWSFKNSLQDVWLHDFPMNDFNINLIHYSKYSR